LKEKIVAGGTVAAFWAVSFLLVITPGADWAYAIAAGLRHRLVFPAVGGLLAGHLAATAVVAAGVGALMARSPLVLTMLTAVGAAYLVWLGIGMLAHPAARRERVWVVAAAGSERRGHQRTQPEGLPAVLGAAAAVHEPKTRAGRSRCRFWCLGWCTLPAAP
jgi:threonine/homoserine/homoserine lactone efflux protein